MRVDMEQEPGDEIEADTPRKGKKRSRCDAPGHDEEEAKEKTKRAKSQNKDDEVVFRDSVQHLIKASISDKSDPNWTRYVFVNRFLFLIA